MQARVRDCQNPDYPGKVENIQLKVDIDIDPDRIPSYKKGSNNKLQGQQAWKSISPNFPLPHVRAEMNMTVGAKSLALVIPQEWEIPALMYVHKYPNGT